MVAKDAELSSSVNKVLEMLNYSRKVLHKKQSIYYQRHMKLATTSEAVQKRC